MPIVLNVVMTNVIMKRKREGKNELKFTLWYNNYGKVADTFTLLAGADIEALRILKSNLVESPCFRAPFSNVDIKKIFWYSCLILFIRDIPQVIIQVFFFFKKIKKSIFMHIYLFLRLFTNFFFFLECILDLL